MTISDRLRGLAEYDSSRRPAIVLVFVPSVWGRRQTERSCERLGIDFAIALAVPGLAIDFSRGLW